MKQPEDVLAPLPRIGLTGQERALYHALLEHGDLTGYEAAREAGISRANSYHGLASLARKGFAAFTEDDPPRHSALAPAEAAALSRARFEREAAVFLAEAPARRKPASPFLTVSGRNAVLERIRLLTDGAKDRVYLACPAAAAEELRPVLEAAARRIKLVLLLDRPIGVPKAIEHVKGGTGDRLRLIADGLRVLTGTLGSAEGRCVYSENAELVALIRESLTNELELMRRKA